MSKHSSQFIHTHEQLLAASSAMAACSVLCVDTEFHRESTYYAEFALLQVYGNGQCWIIDPIAITDLSPLWHIM